MKKIVFLVLIMISLCGCSNNVKNEKKEFPKDAKENEIIIYDRFNQRLVKYDTDKKRVSWKDTANNYFQYEFSPYLDVYTSGHSIDNKFSVIEVVDDKKVKTNLKLDNKEAIFPLVCDDNAELFIHYYYNEKNEEILEKRSICYIEDGKIVDIIKNGAVVYGAIWNDELYYTTYIEEDNKCSLYKASLKYYDSKLVKSGLEKGDLVVTKYGIMHEKDDEFVYLDSNKESNLKYAANTYSTKDGKYVFQIKVNSDANLEFFVTDIEKNEMLWKIEGVVDFKVEGNKVTVYGNDFIEEKEL